MKLSILIPVYNQEELVIKALDHLPRREDVEVLVCDDGSTDRTLERVMAYQMPGLKVYSNWRNRGVAYTKNRLLAEAHGQYFHIHDSDDYVDTELYSKLIDSLDGEDDIVCMDLVVNSGEIYRLTPDTQRYYCAQIARFILKDFADKIWFPENVRAGDDGYFAEDLLRRNPKIRYSAIPAYHYNYPREGSLCDLRLKGILP